jgi:hypothetical protein
MVFLYHCTMNFFERTKANWGERILNARLNATDRNAVACNINQASSIGILFNATEQVSFEIVKELVKNLSIKNREIEVLGYVDTKQLIDHYLYRKGFDFFTRKQLNWYYKPMAENVEDFIKKPFDLLLDLSLDNPFPLKYIVTYSQAKFKAGRYSDRCNYLDLMIDITKEKEAMSALKNEVEKDIHDKSHKNSEVEQIIDKKVQTEIQLNFLINQLVHYLSILKTNL